MKLLNSIIKTGYKFSKTRLLKREMPLTNKIGSRSVLNVEETSEFIRKKILSGESFMVGRYGGCENDIIASYYLNKKLGFPISDKKFNYFCNNAGFFPPNEDLIPNFVSLMKKSALQADMLGIWNWFLEDYIIETDAPNAHLTRLGSLEPWFATNPWSVALKGKKVLVIHPFTETIKHQYESNREKLFANKNTLPLFHLQVYKSVQSIAGNVPNEYSTWFEALDKMKQDISKLDFDISIIGCGAYGFPLASYVKESLGKQAIHLAGATQLLFGIKGSRWEQGNYKDIFKNIFNEYWIRPSQNETPKKSSSIESACYW